MNILLAFKAEPDPGMLSEADWQAAAKGTEGPPPQLMRVAMGGDEQGAAELMLQAQARNPQLNLSAMTVGDERAIPLLRHLASLGFAQRTLISARQDLRFSPDLIARQIAERVREESIALVLLGCESGEGQNGQTGWLLAEMLGWPCISGVTGLEILESGFRVQCDDLCKRSQWQLTPPAILIIRNRGQMALRVPGMRARLDAAKAEIRRIAATGTAAAVLRCTALSRQIPRRAGELITDGTLQERAQRLWKAYLHRRMPR